MPEPLVAHKTNSLSVSRGTSMPCAYPDPSHGAPSEQERTRQSTAGNEEKRDDYITINPRRTRPDSKKMVTRVYDVMDRIHMWTADSGVVSLGI